MVSFLGEFDYTIDDNNRLSIPAKFRKSMTENGQNRFIVTKKEPDYLTLYPQNVWADNVVAKVYELPHSKKEANRLRRLIGLNSTEVSLDSQGRVNIPGDYYQHAGIEKKVKIIGTVDTIQLWNPDVHEKESQKPEEKSFLEELEQFGI